MEERERETYLAILSCGRYKGLVLECFIAKLLDLQSDREAGGRRSLWQPDSSILRKGRKWVPIAVDHFPVVALGYSKKREREREHSADRLGVCA